MNLQSLFKGLQIKLVYTILVHSWSKIYVMEIMTLSVESGEIEEAAFTQSTNLYCTSDIGCFSHTIK